MRGGLVSQDLGDAEVEELHDATAIGLVLDEDVVGLHVAMDHLRAVHGRDRLDDGEQHRARLRDAELALAAEERAERLSAEELHDHHEHAVFGLDEIEHIDHVRVPRPGRRPGFTQEPDPRIAGGDLQDLERDLTTRRELFGGPDRAHGPLAELLAQAKPAREHEIWLQGRGGNFFDGEAHRTGSDQRSAV